MTEEAQSSPPLQPNKEAARIRLEAIYDKFKSPKTAKADFVNDWLEYCTAENQRPKGAE